MRTKVESDIHKTSLKNKSGPSLAQLVERQTVVAAPQQSKGRWFDSCSSDFFPFILIIVEK